MCGELLHNKMGLKRPYLNCPLEEPSVDVQVLKAWVICHHYACSECLIHKDLMTTKLDLKILGPAV